ncbi:MAG: mechanosensitive ion channel family protein [Deltaproteobacteria bacterium]|nr:mechanosensitive ion channel family protein [Deltaproteobacteria bacterium]
MDYLDTVFYGNRVRAWLLCAFVAALFFFGLKLIRYLGVSRLSSMQTTPGWNRAILATLRSTKGLFLLVAGLYLGAQILALSAKVEKIVDRVFLLMLLIQIGMWGSVLIAVWIDRYVSRKAAEDASRATTLRALGYLVRLVFFLVLILWGLDNFGVNITALIAGLGVGGVAVALATQHILGDLFASLSIVLDKPFILGDFIVVGDFMGTIEYVGLKTTRIRSLSGEQLIFSNSDLLQSRIRNFKRMQERRVVFGFSVVHATSMDKLKEIGQTIERIIRTKKLARFDRAHFKGFGTSGFDFEVVYWVLNPDYNIYMDIHQDISLDILRQFHEQHVEFAYQTQTLFLTEKVHPSFSGGDP